MPLAQYNDCSYTSSSATLLSMPVLFYVMIIRDFSLWRDRLGEDPLACSVVIIRTFIRKISKIQNIFDTKLFSPINL